MILHGVRSAGIRQGDTLKEPQHLATNGEIRRSDRVISNPPFSQNYSSRPKSRKRLRRPSSAAGCLLVGDER